MNLNSAISRKKAQKSRVCNHRPALTDRHLKLAVELLRGGSTVKEMATRHGYRNVGTILCEFQIIKK